ncbi:MAG: membrane integrity-associated transporter subunit PqiC [Phycisphaeraceae bacterium]|nr:membrane integrity-associated transporter subunit PqiC [Phycisphaeraceae bacterium]
MRKHRVVFAAATIGLGALGGCNLNQPYPAKSTFVLRAGEIGHAPVTLAESVRVDPVRIAPPYDGRNLVSRTGEVSFSRDYYNVFISPPEDLATAELIRLLSESGVFTRVSGVSSTGNPDVSLECMVTDLYADERDRQHPMAVCRAKFRRVKNEPGTTWVVDDRTFEATEPIGSDSGAGIAAALGRAFGATVSKYVESVGAPAQSPAR